MWVTVLGASFGYVSNANVPLDVSTTITGPFCAAANRGAVSRMPENTIVASADVAAVLSRMLSGDPRHADLRTISANHAAVAPWVDRPAHVLAPRHEIQIDVGPPCRVGRLVQRLLGLVRRPRAD